MSGNEMLEASMVEIEIACHKRVIVISADL